MTSTDTSSPHKASAVEVVRGVDVATLAQAALASCCDQVRLNAPGAKLGEDPAFTHQLRVGTRRLRVALKLFRSLLDAREVAWLEGELKWVFSRLGAQRELDVLLRDTIAPLLELQTTPALLSLRETVEGERARRRKVVHETLSSRRFAKLLRTLQALPAAPVAGPMKRARKFARKKLARRREAVLREYAPALSGDAHRRHQLRKEFKKLRYASELAAPLFKQKRVKRYLAAVEAVQAALGALNDVAAGRNELALLAQGRQVELGTALEACEARFAQDEARELARLVPLLREHAEAAPFWG